MSQPMPALMFRHIFWLMLRSVLAVALLLALLVWLGKVADAMMQGAMGGGAGVERVLMRSFLQTPALVKDLLPHIVLVSSGLVSFRLIKRFELPVLFMAGVSGWQIVTPFLSAGFLIGVLHLGVIDPLAARLERAGRAMEMTSDAPALVQGWPEGSRRDLVLQPGGRQIYAFIDAVWVGEARTGRAVVFEFDESYRFVRRIAASRSEIGETSWRLFPLPDPAAPGVTPEPVVLEVEGWLLTAPPPNRAVAAAHELPALIELADRTGVSSARLRVRLHELIALPVLLAAIAGLSAVMVIRHIALGRRALRIVAELLVLGFVLYTALAVFSALGARNVLPAPLTAWAVALACAFAVPALLRARRL